MASQSFENWLEAKQPIKKVRHQREGAQKATCIHESSEWENNETHPWKEVQEKAFGSGSEIPSVMKARKMSSSMVVSCIYGSRTLYILCKYAE